MVSTLIFSNTTTPSMILVYLPSFFTSAQGAGEWSALGTGHFISLGFLGCRKLAPGGAKALSSVITRTGLFLLKYTRVCNRHLQGMCISYFEIDHDGRLTRMYLFTTISQSHSTLYIAYALETVYLNNQRMRHIYKLIQLHASGKIFQRCHLNVNLQILCSNVIWKI
jgi:hypothetical protein